jgi:hypothetical protein
MEAKMNRLGIVGHGELVAFMAVVLGGCSAAPTEREESGVATTRHALEEPAPPDTSDLTFRILGVRVPTSSIPNLASDLTITMQTSLDGNGFIGTQPMFRCGTAVGGTFNPFVPCNAGGSAQHHPYPEYADEILALISSSPRPQVYVRTQETEPGQTTAAIDVSFGLTPASASGSGVIVFTESAARFRLNVDIASGDVTPELPTNKGGACGFRREDGSITTAGTGCGRTCTNGPECNQTCVFVTGASTNEEWEICYEVEVTPPDIVTTFPLPYFVQSILYEAPGDQSSIEYGASNTCGTSTEWQVKTTTGASLGVEFKQGQVDLGSAKAEATASLILGGSKFTQKTTGTTLSAADPEGERHDIPNPDHDLYYVIVGSEVTKTVSGNPAIPPHYAVDLAKGSTQPLTVLQLKGLAQNPQVLDTIPPGLRTLLTTHINPPAAQQMLALNPRVMGQDPDQNPDRFEPATPPTVTMWETQTGIGQTPTAGAVNVTASGGDTVIGIGAGLKFEGELKLAVVTFGETLEIEYEKVTHTFDSSELTSAIQLKTSSPCLRAPNVEVFLDRAFGTYVTKPPVFMDICQADPMQTMSFESTSAWQVQNGSTMSSTDAVGGLRSLSVSAGGWTPLVSRALSSAMLRSAAKSSDLTKMSFALRIPTGQPNPHWIGAAQMYVSAPSANVHNAYLGQVELTPLPRGEFVRLGYTIPAYALPALTGEHADVSFTIVLNVNAGTSGWLLDDLVIGL